MTTILIFFGLVVLLFGVDPNRRHESNGSFPRGRTIRKYIRAQIRQQRSHFERQWCDHERSPRAATDRGPEPPQRSRTRRRTDTREDSA
jgi:hypothetical protein